MTIKKAANIIDDLVNEHGWNMWRAIQAVSHRHEIQVGFLVNEMVDRAPILETSAVGLED
jgi:hypothetical protein